MEKISVTIWNEFRHEKNVEAVRKIYPDGLHKAIGKQIEADDLEIHYASLDEPEQGLPDSLLNNTDVLLWWGHCAHGEVKDELVTKIQMRVLSGMGLIVLHSGHYSKIFRRMLGTDCRLRWREVGEKERVWTVDASHPIAQGVPETFVIPNSEMYGEPFDIPRDGEIVFMSWYEGGNVFRSGVCFKRDRGNIFYFSPGHEAYPIYYNRDVIQVIANAIRWAAPAKIYPVRTTHQPDSAEQIRTANPGATVHDENGKVK